MHLSVHTVKDRVSRIVAKLDARSRARVALRASDAGLLRAWPSPSRGRARHPFGVASDRSSGDGEPFREHRPVAVGMLRTE